MNYRSLVVINFFLIFTIIFAITASETRKGRPPLIGDGNKKKHKRRSECQFGKRSYELEQTWHPDLGPPFGVMYCIRCECMAVQKKRRITGRTVCKNVKNECPKITCKEPILPPGHCCKICPEEGKEFSLLKEDTFAGYEEDDKSGKDFAGVLVGPLSMQPTFSTAVGSVRLSAHRRNLHYSVTVTPDFKPKGIQFMNDEGTVLEEQEIHDNEYKEATGKVCGAWRRIPRIYRHLLRNEKLWFAIVSEDGAILSTAPMRHRSLASEVLSALLVPLDPSAVGAGGTAVVSLSSASNSVHITLIVSGLMQHEKKEADSILVVSLVASKSEDGEQRVIEQLFSVQKAQDVATIEIRTVLEPHELKQLTRSQVTITVYSKRFPAAKISGIIETRITCDVFDSILEPSSEERKTHGIAWLYLSKDGALNYRVFMNSVNSASTLAIEAIQSKGKKKRIVQELSLVGNWANGTTGRLTPRDLEALYAGELGLRVDEDKDELILQGKIMVHAVTESYFDLSTGPTLLLSSNGGKIAVAWLSVDPSDCSVHYDVQVKFHKKKGESQVANVLELVEAPRPVTSLTHSGKSYLPTSIILSSGTEVENGVLLLSPNVRLLEEFSSVQVDNTITDLSALTLARMETGGTFLKLTESGGADDPRHELQGHIKTVKVPSKCLPQYSKASIMSEETGDSPLGPGYVLDEENEIPKVPRCLYEGRLYEEGAQWTAEHSQCTMCSCQRGRTVCDPIVCPILKCDKIMQVGGECCPVCKNMTTPKVPSSMKSCYFEGDKKYYSAGTKWHPYLPPFGFDKCALCSCNAGTLKVECTRLTCPEPQCPESDRFRPDPKSCCQECRIPEPTQPTKNYENDGEQDEEAQAKSDADILAAGGCRFKGEMFENGSEWNPRILPWGEMKCINCNCKDGRVKCKRRKCIKNRCVAGTRQIKDECCPPCAQEKLKRSKRKKTKRRRTIVSKQ